MAGGAIVSRLVGILAIYGWCYGGTTCGWCYDCITVGGITAVSRTAGSTVVGRYGCVRLIVRSCIIYGWCYNRVRLSSTVVLRWA